MSKLEMGARLKIRDGQLEGFKRQAAECMRRTEEKHTRILRYDWFLSKDETECEVSETYPDPAALVEHHANLGDATATLYAHFAEGHRVTLYGDPPAEFVARVEAARGGKINWYSFLQGLESEPDSSQTPGAGVKPIFELGAHMTVRPGQLDGWKTQTAELMRLTREKDTQTLRYDWFLSQDGTECGVREAYVSEVGLIEHNAHIMEARGKLFRDFADDHIMTIYCQPSQQLIELMNVHAGGARWFSFLQGLGASPTVFTHDREMVAR
jgi:quinol monooxygenase YgiN